jgi:hypothetical protein
VETFWPTMLANVPHGGSKKIGARTSSRIARAFRRAT